MICSRAFQVNTVMQPTPIRAMIDPEALCKAVSVPQKLMKEDPMQNLSAYAMERRGFLKGAASLGALAAATSLAGCAPQSPSKAASSDLAKTNATQSRPWENAPEPIDESEVAETVEADIVIVGAGMAGMAAFMYAAEEGAETVILEQRDTFSGRGLDFAAIDTKVQKEAGIEIDRGQLVSDLVKASGFKANGSLIKLWADHSGAIFDRLIDMTIADGGTVTLGSGSSATANAEDFTTRTYPTDHMFGGLVEGPCALIERMQNAGIAAGGQTFYSMKAEQLGQEDGRVTAVYARDAEGTLVKFVATRGVILATGDYGNNPDMIQAWCPLAAGAEGNVYPEATANTGDGITMALWAGGTVQPSAHAAMIHPIFGGGALSTASFLKVNNEGKRFCNENTTLPGISNMYLTSKDHQVWSIFDADFDEATATMSPLSMYNNNTAGPLTAMFGSGDADPSNPPSNAEVIDYCMANGTTVKADSLAELAEALSIPGEALEATVARYNELADAGKDVDFGKNAEDLRPIRTAPFYASALTAKVLVIASGLNVNGEMQVLDAEDAPIEGLYAVGNVMGNFFANDYPICAPGLSHGRCLTLGALIGRAVATGQALGA